MPVSNTSILFTSSSGIGYYPLSPEDINASFDGEGEVCTDFVGKANGYKTARGRKPGQGYILLKRSDVANLDLNATTHNLTFREGATGTISLQNLCIVSVLAVTGTVNADDKDIMLVELGDTRHIAMMSAIDKSYNVPSVDVSDYYTSTKNAGVAWTWTTFIQNLWSLLPGVGALSLTDAAFPAEVPENYCFRGMRTWDAFCQAAEDSGNYIVWNRDGTYSLIARGFADTSNRNAINTAHYDYKTLNPSWPNSGSAITLPETFRVFFPAFDYAFQQSTDNLENTFTEWWRNKPLYSVDVTTSGLTGMAAYTTIAGTVKVLHAARGAYYTSAGVLVNSAALSTEATLLAQHEADACVVESGRQDIFMGLVTISPGVCASAIAWYDYGNGIRTEVFLSPENTPSLYGSGGSVDATTDSLSIAAKDGVGPPDLTRWDLPFERFAVCKLSQDLAPHSRVSAYVQYGTIAGTTVSWSNTGLPHTVFVYEAFGDAYSENDIIYCAFYSQLRVWIALPRSRDVIRFRLTASLSNGGSAAAKRLAFDGTTYNELEDIVVFDWWAVAVGLSTRGMWQGVSGMEGVALKREVPATPGVLEYDIIWMETYAWSLEGTTTTDLLGNTATTTVNKSFEQGVSPGAEVTIHDDQTFFPRSLSGAKVKGTRSEYEGVQAYYKAINAQQMVLYGTAFLTADLDAADPTGSIAGAYSWYTFSPFNQPPDPLPTSAINPLSLTGASGSVVFIVWDEDVEEWAIINVAPTGSEPVIQFRLTSDLANGGSASANIISWNGAGYDVGAAITVFDWHTTRGMWQGKVGHEGFAYRRSGTDYDIIWMATYAWSLEGTLTADLGNLLTPAPSIGQAAAITSHAFEQGISPGNVTHHDDQGMYPRSLEGARVKSVRTEYMGVNPYYKTLVAQQLTIHATAELKENLCGEPKAKIVETTFVARMFSPFNQTPEMVDELVDNRFRHRGQQGDLVWLVWFEADPQNQEEEAGWVICDIAKRPLQITVDVYWDDVAKCFKKLTNIISAEICGPSTPSTIICAEECP